MGINRAKCRNSTALVALLSTVFLISGCGPFPGSPRAKAHEAIKQALFDPDAAQFRNEETSSSGDVCGEVNSKNRFGAYVGFSRYVYTGSSGLVGVSEGDPDFAEYYRESSNEFMRDDAFKKIQNACTFAAEWNIYCPEDMKSAEENANRQCKLWTSGGADEQKLKAEVGAD